MLDKELPEGKEEGDRRVENPAPMKGRSATSLGRKRPIENIDGGGGVVAGEGKRDKGETAKRQAVEEWPHQS